MRYLAAEAVQRVVRRLRYQRDQVAELLGTLTGGKMPAVVNSARMTLNLREHIQRSMFLGTYEPWQTSWFRRCLRLGDTVVDVGASFGYYTTLSSRLVGPSGRVFAFEPSPMASKVIEEMVEASRVENVVLTRAALGREATRVNLLLPNTPHLHSPSILPSDDGFSPHEVPVMRLDEFEPLKSRGRIALVKIDVEGFEPDVIEGMDGLLKEGRVENIVCEFNSGWLGRNNTTPRVLFQKIFNLGFEISASTDLQKDLVGHRGERFSLQDVWFSRLAS